MFHLPPALVALRAIFQSKGFDIRLVGGCVRDFLAGQEPKDLDFCTDATPDEQIALYEAAKLRYIPTDKEHGTIRVVLEGEVYEITTLRVESDHDGRYATMTFTNDWIADLSRRDLTINAISMTFDGEIIDPFGGRDDLKARRVRFVGDPAERMREDYLRILRWLRFHGRYAPGERLDSDAVDAALVHGIGLRDISRERIWSEVSRIVTGPDATGMMKAIMRMGLADYMDLPHGSILELERMRNVRHPDPVVNMVAFLIDPRQVAKLARDWKWSRAEADKASFLADHLMDDTIDLKRLMTVYEIDKDWVLDLAHLQGRFSHALYAWEIPVFPVTGKDLIETGMKPGKGMGVRLSIVKDAWAESNYKLPKEKLLAIQGVWE